MRGRTRAGVAAIVLTSLLVLGACSTKKDVDTSSGGDGTSTTAAQNTTTTAAKAATRGEAEDMLLTLSDLPPGWSTGTSTDGSSDDSDNSSFVCPSAEDSIPSGGTGDTPSADFTQGTYGPFLAQVVVPATPTKYDDVVSALNSCIGQTWSSFDDDGTETQWTMAELSAEKLGDESTAYRITGTLTGGSVTVDMIVGHTDRVASVVFGISVQTIVGGGSLDGADFANIVKTASDKLS